MLHCAFHTVRSDVLLVCAHTRLPCQGASRMEGSGVREFSLKPRHNLSSPCTQYEEVPSDRLVKSNPLRLCVSQCGFHNVRLECALRRIRLRTFSPRTVGGRPRLINPPRPQVVAQDQAEADRAAAAMGASARRAAWHTSYGPSTCLDTPRTPAVLDSLPACAATCVTRLHGTQPLTRTQTAGAQGCRASVA